MATNLQSLLKNEIVTNVIDGTVTENGWKVLVVDAAALKVITNCCRMAELMDHSIVIVEDIKKSKQPMQHEAIYFMAPTFENIEFLKSDFKTRMRYPGIHIHFIDQAEDAIVEALSHKLIKKYIRSVKEHNLSVVPTESQVFSMDVQDGMKHFYSPDSPSSRAPEVATRLASLCAALGEYPIVRYSKSSNKCHTLARLTQSRLDELKKNEPRMEAGKNKKSQLIILDRNFDLMSPVLHELTYQAAAYDLCGIEKDVFEYSYEDGTGKTRQKRAVLEETDDVWHEFRHEHISSVMANINKQFKSFMQTQAQNEGASKSAAADLKDMMKSMPQHQEKVAQFSLHISLAGRIMKNLTPDVEECIRAQQNLVTGVNREGEKVKDFIPEISSVLANKKLGPFESGSGKDLSRLRALMVCVLASGGLDQDVFERVMQLIPEYYRPSILNLKHLGVDVTTTKSSKKKKVQPKRKKREVAFELSRWVPLIKDICEDIIAGSLDTETYPSLTTAPKPLIEVSGNGDEEQPVQSARKKGKRGGWAHKTKSVSESESTRHRVIIFIPGAISFNEIRTVYEITEQYNVDVLIGSHCVTTPNQFVHKLNNLSDVNPAQMNVATMLMATEL
eukprot:m.29131 g.29131  ORF g.29131 m.29131 type:complete len:617 (-) comp16045_c0_seq1:47-1897(-)